MTTGTGTSDELIRCPDMAPVWMGNGGPKEPNDDFVACYAHDRNGVLEPFQDALHREKDSQNIDFRVLPSEPKGFAGVSQPRSLLTSNGKALIRMSVLLPWKYTWRDANSLSADWQEVKSQVRRISDGLFVFVGC